MTLLLDEPVTAGDPKEPGEMPGDGPSLEDLIAGTWETLAIHGVAACPACGGELERVGDETPPLHGRCRRCGSTLS